MLSIELLMIMIIFFKDEKLMKIYFSPKFQQP
jgi:hypothetical protein